MRRLIDHLYRPGLREHRERCRLLFWSSWADVFDDAEVDALCTGMLSEVSMTCFQAIDEVVVGAGCTVLGHLLESRGSKLSPGVRRALEDLGASRLELHDVVDAQPEAGRIVLKRVTDGEELSLSDHSAPAGLKPGDLLAARLIRRDTGDRVIGADFYTYPASTRDLLLDHLEGLDDPARDARVFHDLWISSQMSHGPTQYPHFVADLRHYLDGDDLSILIPKEARAIGLYIGRIAAGACASSAGATVDTFVRCRRRPGNRPCGSRVLAHLDRDRRVGWACPGCGDSGTISGWEGTPFDLAERVPILDRDDPDAPSDMRVFILPSSEFRRLLGLVHLTGPALSLLASARPLVSGKVRLVGRPDEFVALARCIAFHFARSPSLSRTAGDVLHELHGGLALYGDGRPDLSPAAQCAEVLLFERSRRSSLRPVHAHATRSHRLHVRLLDIEPPIWRLLEVPGHFTLEDLYEALILAFAWSDTHLHVFEQDGRRFGRPDPHDYLPLDDERVVLVADALPRVGARMIFEYDLGDSWRHEIVVEEVLDEAPERPRLIAGERSSPPEDCGGPPGYERLLEILADPFDEEHESMLEWAGDFSPEELDLDRVDERVSRMACAGTESSAVRG